MKNFNSKRAISEQFVNALVHKTHPLSSPKNLVKILVPIYKTQEDSVKHARQKSSFKRQNTAYHGVRFMHQCI
jgi:hypothetical protein